MRLKSTGCGSYECCWIPVWYILVPFTWKSFNFLVVDLHSVHWLLLLSVRLKCNLTCFLLVNFSKVMINHILNLLMLSDIYLFMPGIKLRNNKSVLALSMKPIQYGFWVSQGLGHFKFSFKKVICWKIKILWLQRKLFQYFNCFFIAAA